MPLLTNTIYDTAAPNFKYNKEWVKKSFEYAEGIKNLEERAKGKKVDPQKFVLDHAVGKIAEFAIAQYMVDYWGCDWVEPDCQIYDVAMVGYDPDLVYCGAQVHVKSCRPGRVKSWNVACNDALSAGLNANDWIGLVVVDPNFYCCSISGLVNSMFVRNNQMLRKGELKKYWDTKQFIYSEDLERCAVYC